MLHYDPLHCLLVAMALLPVGQVTEATPAQRYLCLRLQRARQLMLSEGLDAASAAHRVGYESPSQFSREYRRLFGAPPRTEVQQLG